MFDFGRPEDTAELYWNISTSRRGPYIPDCHYEEMDLKELKDFFTYIYMTLSDALRDNASEDVVEVITAYYDEVFQYLASVDQGFRRVVASGKHHYLPNRKEKTVRKYKKLAGLWSD